MYHKKTFTLSIPLLFIILIYSCKPSDKISEEDYKIINVLVKERIKPSIDKYFLSEDLKKYKKNNLDQDIKIIDSIINTRKYYFKLSDTLYSINLENKKYKDIISGSFVFFPNNQNYNIPLKFDKKKVKYNSNTIEVETEKNRDENYIGSYRISRVILNKHDDRAVVELKIDAKQSLFEGDKIFLLEKDNKQWKIIKVQ